MVVPFGVGQFAHDKKRRGTVYAITEATLAGLATFSYVNMVSLAADGKVDEELRWRMVSAVSTAGFAGVYTAQVIDGARLWQLDAEGHEGLALELTLPPPTASAWLPADPAVARFVAIPGA